MAQSPYILTIPSSTFTGATTATVDLGGGHRHLQVVTYLSTDTVYLGAALSVSVTKTENINVSQYTGGGAYDPALANHDISTIGVLYSPMAEGFYRFVKISVTGSSASFTTGTATVVVNFDGCGWPV